MYSPQDHSFFRSDTMNILIGLAIVVAFIAILIATFHAGGEYRIKHYWAPVIFAKDDPTPVQFDVHETITGPIEIVYVPAVERADLVGSATRIAELEQTLTKERKSKRWYKARYKK